MSGWVLTPGRRTITSMIEIADPTAQRAHDAYHRFVRDGVWQMRGLWRLVVTHAVTRLVPTGPLSLDCDDTLFHRPGRKVHGAGLFRDAVRSTKDHHVNARGLNLVVLTLRVTPPWGSVPIALPVNVRLHRKNDVHSTIEHAAQMIREIAGWLPDRQLHVCADGAYISLAGDDLKEAHLTSRIRRNAAIYEPAPPPTGRRGRPRSRGDRLPSPEQLAQQARPRQWQHAEVNLRGRTCTRLVLTRTVLWFGVNRTRPVLLVIVRDPDDIEPDDFFFTTDLTATGAQTATRYAGRWSIEVCFRDTKQDLGGEQPQSWQRKGPERAACLALWLHAMTWLWYLIEHPMGQTWKSRPWYRDKHTPSFLDALAALRTSLWRQRICRNTRADSLSDDNTENIDALISTLVYAA